ncbi:MAG TPA: thioredoxin family protein [Acetobacteraceae bacterium]|nr:thioredoxin family protein [Acetobacteraceae bacterium]
MTTPTTDTIERSQEGIENHRIVCRDDWIAERKVLLAREKELTRLRDQVARERRALPWVRIDKNYIFATPEGPRTLAGLFDGRRQLMVQHFMLAPGWEEGCPSCSFMADHNDGMTVHLANRDVTLVAISRAPLAEIERFRRRMGWRFPWVSSHGTTFNYDFGVSFTPEEVAKGVLNYNFGPWPFSYAEWPGVSVFFRDDMDAVFHTFSTYGRGVEVMMGTYNMLDLTPKGRDEREVEYKMEWVRHHDRYEPAPQAAVQPTVGSVEALFDTLEHKCCG